MLIPDVLTAFSRVFVRITKNREGLARSGDAIGKKGRIEAVQDMVNGVLEGAVKNHLIRVLVVKDPIKDEGLCLFVHLLTVWIVFDEDDIVVDLDDFPVF